MSLAMLNAGGPDFDVDAFLQSHPGVPCSSVWHRGEVGRRGRVNDESGFCAEVVEFEDRDELVEAVGRFLEPRSRFFADLAAHGASSRIHIGLYVGSEKSFAPSILFPPAVLQLLAERSVHLVVSGYPVSDPED